MIKMWVHMQAQAWFREYAYLFFSSSEGTKKSKPLVLSINEALLSEVFNTAEKKSADTEK